MGNLWGNSQSPVAQIPTQFPVVSQPVAPKIPLPASLASFDVAVAFTLQNEGGFSDDPNDAGGATNFGITINDLAEWRKDPVSVEDVKNLTVAEAESIYKSLYWDPALECLFQGAATAIFDFGVLHGTGSARSLAQSSANALGASPELQIDGEIGPLSIAAINSYQASFCQAYASAIKAIFAEIVAGNPSQKVFLAGWDARANRIAALS